MIELKKCPFCGSTNVTIKEEWDSFSCVHYTVKCQQCLVEKSVNADLTKSVEYNEQKAIEAWNKRPNPWHTGTPTEEGNYIAHLRIKSRDGKFIEYDMTCNLEVLLNYIRCQDESEENYLVIKGWMMYEPYEGNK